MTMTASRKSTVANSPLHHQSQENVRDTGHGATVAFAKGLEADPSGLKPLGMTESWRASPLA